MWWLGGNFEGTLAIDWCTRLLLFFNLQRVTNCTATADVRVVVGFVVRHSRGKAFNDNDVLN